MLAVLDAHISNISEMWIKSAAAITSNQHRSHTAQLCVEDCTCASDKQISLDLEWFKSERSISINFDICKEKATSDFGFHFDLLKIASWNRKGTHTCTQLAVNYLKRWFSLHQHHFKIFVTFLLSLHECLLLHCQINQAIFTGISEKSEKTDCNHEISQP